MSILSKDFRDKLSNFIGNIEKKSGVEVVVAIAPKSGNYIFIPLIVSLVFISLGISFTVFSDEEFDDEWLVFIPLIFGAIGFLISSIPILHSILTPKNIKIRNTEIYARASFQKGNIYETVSRQGILIYISIFENEIVFLEDKVVLKRIPFDELSKMKSNFKTVFKSFPDGKSSERLNFALESMIPICEKFIPIEANDVNEIPDDLEIIL